jgi:hypothetical protein
MNKIVNRAIKTKMWVIKGNIYIIKKIIW